MPHASQDIASLRRRAGARGGVVSVDDLRECGFSAASVRRRLASGDWHRWGRAVVLGPPPSIQPREGFADSGLSERGIAWALQLTYGPHAAISGALAMRRSGWELPTSEIVVVLRDRPRIAVAGVHVMRRELGTVLVLPGGRRYVPAMQALLDTLVRLDAVAGADLLDAALQRRVIDAVSFADAVQERCGRGRTGAACLRALRDRALSGSRSEAEQRMRALLRRCPTGPWAANLAVRDAAGRLVAEIDFAHERLGIAIEVDGRAHHSDRRSFERDRTRQNLLVVAGWLVLRFTWEQMTQRPDEVLAAIDAAVRMRLHA